ncbi:hypothetical protein RchiOBHm_Chr0c44g0503671 [Rosa chinensis]|uniref:Uncharacterized protein n=1 Tax=Rosa chinensis TaxID=74649 RepID=A0A2P6SQ02_ROSCH|nr:hypothetical protein RchiOBHm_Chr0c44g0503671 [Rosa chinensis]
MLKIVRINRKFNESAVVRALLQQELDVIVLIRLNHVDGKQCLIQKLLKYQIATTKISLQLRTKIRI